MKFFDKVAIAFVWLATSLVAGAPLCAQGLAPDDAGDPAKAKPGLLGQVGIDQHLNQQIPLHLVFNDESGREVQLGEFFGKRPVILAMVYYECPMLCTQVINAVAGSITAMNFDAGRQFDVLVVSFDPGETPSLAAGKRAAFVKRYGRPGTDAGIHFLTGRQSSIDALTRSAPRREAATRQASRLRIASTSVPRHGQSARNARDALATASRIRSSSVTAAASHST